MQARLFAAAPLFAQFTPFKQVTYGKVYREAQDPIKSVHSGSGFCRIPFVSGKLQWHKPLLSTLKTLSRLHPL